MSGFSKNSRLFRWEDFAAPNYVPYNIATAGLQFHTATLVGSYIYVIGPLDETPFDKQHTVCILDLVDESWTWVNLQAPYFLYHSTFLMHDSLFVYGGEQDRKGFSDDLWRLDLVEQEWSPVHIHDRLASPGGLESFGSGFLEKTMEFIVCCGQNHRGVLQNGTWLLHADSGTWRVPEIAGRPPSPRSDVALCTAEEAMFVYGGKSKTEVFSDLHVLNCAKKRFQWSLLLRNTGVSRFDASLSYVHKKLFLFGGTDENDQNNLEKHSELYIFDLTKSYRELLEVSQHSRRFTLVDETSPVTGHKAVLGHNGLYIVGGNGRRFENIQILRGKS